ncbi:MAG: hypothetical protein ACFFAH_17060 [Promethearchaeota archaeon]
MSSGKDDNVSFIELKKKAKFTRNMIFDKNWLIIRKSEWISELKRLYFNRRISMEDTYNILKVIERSEKVPIEMFLDKAFDIDSQDGMNFSRMYKKLTLVLESTSKGTVEERLINSEVQRYFIKLFSSKVFKNIK